MRVGPLFCCAGLALCASLLVMCAVRDIGFAAPVFMAVGLVAIVAGALAWFRHRRSGAGIAALLLAAVVVVLSLMEWYAPHWTPKGGRTHWHSVWDLGHVH